MAVVAVVGGFALSGRGGAHAGTRGFIKNTAPTSVPKRGASNAACALHLMLRTL